MCCCGNIEATRNFICKNKRYKTKTVYKVVYKDSGYITSIYQNMVYCPGLISANCISPRIKRNQDIYNGIHVFLSKKSALSLAKEDGIGAKVMALQVKIKDLIGVGDFGEANDNAVFNKVTLTHKEYKRLMRLKNSHRYI